MEPTVYEVPSYLQQDRELKRMSHLPLSPQSSSHICWPAFCPRGSASSEALNLPFLCPLSSITQGQWSLTWLSNLHPSLAGLTLAPLLHGCYCLLPQCPLT